MVSGLTLLIWYVLESVFVATETACGPPIEVLISTDQCPPSEPVWSDHDHCSGHISFDYELFSGCIQESDQHLAAP